MEEKKQLPKTLICFLVLFKIGLFTFGGGWSIIAQMQNDFIHRRTWLTDDELMDIVSMGRSLPGVMVINTSVLFGYRIVACCMVLFGALATLETVWSLADLTMALMTLCNLAAIAQLGRYAFRLLDHYRAQKRAGIREPLFHKNDLPEIASDIECWEEEEASNR